MATDINTLARQCGVSKSTISRVFTGKARVSEQLRARVLLAARELNYHPQQVMARDCIAIIVGDHPSPACHTSFNERLLTSAIFEITRHNLLTEIISLQDLPKLYNGYTRGLLLLLPESLVEEHAGELKRLSMPVLTVNQRHAFTSSVMTDHGEGVRLALEHLFENGHRRIGLVIDRFDNQAGNERLEAYTRFRSEHDLPALPAIEYCTGTADRQGTVLHSLLAEQDPTALIVCGESIALHAVQELNTLGKRIPEDISLITSELADVSCWMTPPLTTIDQDLDMLAGATVAELARRIHAPAAPATELRLPTRLIRRASVRRIEYIETSSPRRKK